jgi:hypothetical protein
MRTEKSLKKSLNIKVFLLYFKFYRIFFSKNSHINFFNLYLTILNSFFGNYQKILLDSKIFLKKSGVVRSSTRLGGDVLSIRKNLKFSNIDEYSAIQKSFTSTNIEIFSKKKERVVKAGYVVQRNKFHNYFSIIRLLDMYVVKSLFVKLFKLNYIFF